jgi:hypothetical protein
MDDGAITHQTTCYDDTSPETGMAIGKEASGDETGMLHNDRTQGHQIKKEVSEDGRWGGVCSAVGEVGS